MLCKLPLQVRVPIMVESVGWTTHVQHMHCQIKDFGYMYYHKHAQCALQLNSYWEHNT